MTTKVSLRIAVFFLVTYKFAISQNDLQRATEELIKLRDEFASGNSPGDILFLMDTTGSVSDWGFHVETRFIANFLQSIPVTKGTIRVELIPFSLPQVSSYIDQVSNPTTAMNKCTLTEKLSRWQHDYGWATNIKGAFQQAFDVCIGSDQKRSVRTVVILLTDGYWNYPSEDPNPIPIAQNLHAANVEVYVIGIAYVDSYNLRKLVKNPAKQAFFLENFHQLYELSLLVRGDALPISEMVTSDNCGIQCDPIAWCSCYVVLGLYSCQCPEGHVGSGLVGQCHRLPGRK